MRKTGLRWSAVLLCMLLVLLMAGFVGCKKEETPSDDDTKEPDKEVVKTEYGMEIADYTEYEYDMSKQDVTRSMKFHEASNASESQKKEDDKTPAEDVEQSTIQRDPEIHFLNGQTEADCAVVLLPNGKTMLFNAGSADEEFGTYLQSYLKSLKVKSIDYLVLSGYDDMRIGQLKPLAEAFDTSKAEVYVKGRALSGNNESLIHEEMKALEKLDTNIYANYMTTMRILQEKYGNINFVSEDHTKATISEMTLDFFNTDFTAYKEYRDWMLCCRLSYGDASVVFMGQATTNVLDKYAEELAGSSVIRTGGHQKAYYSKDAYEKLASKLVVSQLPESLAENTLEKSDLQNFLQKSGIKSYVTGASKSEVVIRFSNGQALIANGVQPTVVEFVGYWTDWID